MHTSAARGMGARRLQAPPPPRVPRDSPITRCCPARPRSAQRRARADARLRSTAPAKAPSRCPSRPAKESILASTPWPRARPSTDPIAFKPRPRGSRTLKRPSRAEDKAARAWTAWARTQRSSRSRRRSTSAMFPRRAAMPSATGPRPPDSRRASWEARISTAPRPSRGSATGSRTDMVLTCSSCTSCNVTTNCSAGTLNLFSDGSCATSVGSVAANGACNSLSTGKRGGGRLDPIRRPGEFDVRRGSIHAIGDPGWGHASSAAVERNEMRRITLGLRSPLAALVDREKGPTLWTGLTWHAHIPFVTGCASPVWSSARWSRWITRPPFGARAKATRSS